MYMYIRRPYSSTKAVRGGCNCSLCLPVQMVCYADRTNISLAILPMAEERGYKESTTGFILSSFFIGCTKSPGPLDPTAVHIFNRGRG